MEQELFYIRRIEMPVGTSRNVLKKYRSETDQLIEKFITLNGISKDQILELKFTTEVESHILSFYYSDYLLFDFGAYLDSPNRNMLYPITREFEMVISGKYLNNQEALEEYEYERLVGFSRFLNDAPLKEKLFAWCRKTSEEYGVSRKELFEWYDGHLSNSIVMRLKELDKMD